MKKLALLFVGISFLAATQTLSYAEETTARFIEIQGDSMISVPPNEVHISITVERQDFNLKDAKEKASKATRKIIDLAKKFQSDSKLIETNFVDVQPRYENEHTKQEFLGYFARSSLTIVFTNQEAYYQFMHKLPSEAGDHTLRVWFELGKIDEFSIQVQQRAVENAKTKAEALAKSVGATLGDVLQIRDVNVQKEGGGQYPIMMMSKREDSSAGQPDMEAGLKEIRAYATVRFQLK